MLFMNMDKNTVVVHKVVPIQKLKYYTCTCESSHNIYQSLTSILLLLLLELGASGGRFPADEICSVESVIRTDSED